MENQINILFAKIRNFEKEVKQLKKINEPQTITHTLTPIRQTDGTFSFTNTFMTYICTCKRCNKSFVKTDSNKGECVFCSGLLGL